MVNFAIRIVKLALIIINICYFLGIIWIIITDLCLEAEIIHQKSLGDEALKAHNTESFLTYYELEDNDARRNTIVGLYFAFTTLSTVGFGDYAPRSNVER